MTSKKESAALRKDYAAKVLAHFDLVGSFGDKRPSAAGRAKLAVTGKAMEAASRALGKVLTPKERTLTLHVAVSEWNSTPLRTGRPSAPGAA